jgi:predicted CopG family antitoxin
MAVKTITIDMAAYDLLSRRKREGESFSDVIKAHFAPQFTAKQFRERLRTLRPLSEETLDRMEEVVRDRKKSPLRKIEPFDSL